MHLITQPQYIQTKIDRTGREKIIPASQENVFNIFLSIIDNINNQIISKAKGDLDSSIIHHHLIETPREFHPAIVKLSLFNHTRNTCEIDYISNYKTRLGILILDSLKTMYSSFDETT